MLSGSKRSLIKPSIISYIEAEILKYISYKNIKIFLKILNNLNILKEEILYFSKIKF